MSGKTQSTCYVEFGTYSDAQRMVQRRNNRALGTRNVQLSIVPQEELMEAVFPRFRGEWRGVDPWIREVEEGQCSTNVAIAGSPVVETNEYVSRDGIVTGGFVSREEINSILTHAKTYRVGSLCLGRVISFLSFPLYFVFDFVFFGFFVPGMRLLMVVAL